MIKASGLEIDVGFAYVFPCVFGDPIDHFQLQDRVLPVTLEPDMSVDLVPCCL